MPLQSAAPGQNIKVPSGRLAALSPRAWLRRSIRHGEERIAGLMVLYAAGLLCLYYILKPMRSALFLKDLPARDLPNAYLLAAVLAAPLVLLTYKCGRRLSVIALITATNAAVLGCLLFFRWAVSAGIPWLPYLYFAFVQVIPVLCIAQFWLLAGYIFDGRQAKRIFGFLGAGAIIGSIAGSVVTDLLHHYSMTAMLTICAVLCAALTALARVAWNYRRPDLDTARESGGGPDAADRGAGLLHTVFGSRLLRLMVLIVFLTMIASQIADWQVDYAAQEHYGHLPKPAMEQEIKAFRARFNWITNLIGLVLQLCLTGALIRWTGIAGSILFLPVSLGLTSLGVLFAPSLATATASLGCSSVFRYSVHRAGSELLFLPLSPPQRKRVKLFVDVFADRIGRAVAAFIILALTTRALPIGLPGTASVVVLLALGCVLCSVRLHRGYVDAFRRQLVRREVDLSEVNRYVTDAASLRLLISMLKSRTERQILYSLGLLQSARNFDFSAELLPLLEHPSAFVREEAVRTLHALPGNHEQALEPLLRDPSDGVRNAAVEYLCMHDPAGTREKLRELLDRPDPDIRLAAARCAARQPETVFFPSMDLIHGLLGLVGSRKTEANEVAAQLAARRPAVDSVPLLRRLMRDPNRRIAASAVAAAGRAGHTQLVPDILSLLSDPGLRPVSRKTLAAFGPKIVPFLAAALDDGNAEAAVRLEIPWILGRLQDPHAARVLVHNLTAVDFRLRYRIVKALSRMRAGAPRLPGQSPLVDVQIMTELMAYYEGLAMVSALHPAAGDPGAALVETALRERMDQQLEMIFRLLGLRYPQRDIYFAYAALKGTQPAKRASAIEFLDNILRKDVKTVILPLLEEESQERLLGRAVRLFHVRIPDRAGALSALVEQPDPWLRACALHAAGAARIAALEPFCRAALGDADIRVRETAEWALGRLSGNEPPSARPNVGSGI